MISDFRFSFKSKINLKSTISIQKYLTGFIIDFKDFYDGESSLKNLI